MSKLLDSINKSSSQVGETKQQYSTRARKFNRVLNNRSGALGNVELLIVEGKPKLVMKGQFGPYIKYKSLNATIPEEKDPNELTMEEALILIEKRKEYDKTKKKRRKK